MILNSVMNVVNVIICYSIFKNYTNVDAKNDTRRAKNYPKTPLNLN